MHSSLQSSEARRSVLVVFDALRRGSRAMLLATVFWHTCVNETHITAEWKSEKCVECSTVWVNATNFENLHSNAAVVTSPLFDDDK